MASSSTTTKFFCFLIIMGLALPTPSLAINYDVGGLTGWCTALIPLLPGLPKAFNVGDVLHFVTFGINLLPLPLPLSVPFFSVTAENYANCVTAGAPFASTTANTACFPIHAPGVYYIISDPFSCSLGLKFQFTVAV